VLAIPVAFVAMRWNVASIVVAGAIAISIGLLFNRWRSAAK
jgi:hypothetical protein